MKYPPIIEIFPISGKSADIWSYKPASGLEEAKRLLLVDRGKHFDPVILDIFIERFDDTVVLIGLSFYRRVGSASIARVIPRRENKHEARAVLPVIELFERRCDSVRRQMSIPVAPKPIYRVFTLSISPQPAFHLKELENPPAHSREIRNKIR